MGIEAPIQSAPGGGDRRARAYGVSLARQADGYAEPRQRRGHRSGGGGGTPTISKVEFTDGKATNESKANQGDRVPFFGTAGQAYDVTNVSKA